MSTKTSKKKLLRLIEDDIILYLGSGKLSNSIFELDKINLNIEKEGLNKLLDIHFLLSKNVKEFILNLIDNLRKFNTSTRKQEILTRGQIKGSVSWSKTLQARNNINPKDKTIFKCNENYKNFNTKENIVLKYFLSKIYSIIKTESFKNYENYDWFKDIQSMKRILENIYLKNIYLSRVDISNFKLNDRILEDVSKNKNMLYKKAAKLLKYHKNLKDLNENTIRELLKNTFIELSDESTLFELYWILKIIKNNAKNQELYILEKNKENNMVAKWKNDSKIYTIYHNSSGSDEISFNTTVDEIRNVENEFIKRQVEVIDKTNEFANKIFDSSYNGLFNGRPDILIEIRAINSDKLIKVILGEVKHTTNKNYSIQGLKELLEYCKFIKDKKTSKFISDNIEIEGLLFLDNIDINNNQCENIRIITMKDEVKQINILDR